MIKQYRLRPVTIEAFQWTWNGSSVHDLKKFTNDLVKVDCQEVPAWEAQWSVYNTRYNEWMPFNSGDFIVKGQYNEFFPLPADMFNRAYEEVGGFLDD